MKAKLNDSHPSDYIKVEVKPGLFVSVSKRFHTLPDEYENVLCAHKLIEIQSDTCVSSPITKKETHTKKKRVVKKKQSFLRSLVEDEE